MSNGRADHCAARDEGLDLLVGELAIARDKRPAVVMAGQHRPAEDLQRLPERFVGQMRRVEDHADAFHFPEQGRPFFLQSAVRLPVP